VEPAPKVMIRLKKSMMRMDRVLEIQARIILMGAQLLPSAKCMAAT